MCDPVTMTTLSIVAGGTQAFSQVQQGKEAMGVARYNAREQENQATAIRNKGVEEENIQRRQTAETLSLQRAQLAASGIDIDAGSAGDLQADTELLGEVDALRVRTNFLDQADTVDRQADLTISQGRAARRASNLAAVGTVLSTAATVGMINAPVPAASAGAAGAASGSNGAVASKWYSTNSSLNFSPRI